MEIFAAQEQAASPAVVATITVVLLGVMIFFLFRNKRK